MGERFKERALRGVDAALETSEGIEGAGIGFAKRGIHELCRPELCFEAVKTAKLPIVMDQSVDQEELERGGRLELFVVAARECFELLWIFTGNDLGAGVDAGF